MRGKRKILYARKVKGNRGTVQRNRCLAREVTGTRMGEVGMRSKRCKR